MTINAKCMLKKPLTLSGLYPSSRDFSIAERTLTKIDFQLKLIKYYYLFRTGIVLIFQQTCTKPTIDFRVRFKNTFL